ncbi:helix-turn-helix domain-containing protein [Hydrogenophaga sp. PAMC20947]|uniref:GlxA family transcriptional regulator n=1 Tax=Hydrogenophaga sp. PAMC20947 TaxID=2565558 RepID=UPI0014453619|nr:helix-turn-helix domain-containing protein [Hydrogenophaga sp. PAMC20947]
MPKSTIVLLAAENSSPSVLYGLFDVLYSVGAVFLDMTAGKPGAESLDVKIVSKDGQPFRCVGEIGVEPHAAITEIHTADAVVVCDMYSPIDMAPIEQYPAFATWLQAMHGQGAIVASVCSGALVLAEAGLLNGREAATHWAYGALFAQHYPDIQLRKDSVLCLSAAKDRIVTAGGGTAWQDLALYLIARFCGHRQACETAKVHLLSGHEDGQLPFAAMNDQINDSDKVISQCQAWVAENFAQPNPVRLMAERAGLNIRTLSRRFRSATGQSPIGYVQCLRVEEAKRMLEDDKESIDGIGAAVGYDDSASFRRLFRRQVGLPPAAYRKKFAFIHSFDKAARG